MGKGRVSGWTQPPGLCFLFKNTPEGYKWQVWTHHKPTQYSQSDRALGVLNTTSRGGAEGQRHQKPNVKRINKNHDATPAELADRLDRRRRRQRQTSRLGERHDETGIPASLTPLWQTLVLLGTWTEGRLSKGAQTQSLGFTMAFFFPPLPDTYILDMGCCPPHPLFSKSCRS